MMESRDRNPGTRGTTALSSRGIAVVALGNFIEWYDYGVYASFATVIAAEFFPSSNRTTALLSTFAAFGVGFFARPLGGLVFGHFGDKLGRRRMLAYVIFLMAGATTLTGLLPGYSSAGIIAPIALAIARLIQGFAVGGEYGGAATYIVEHAPPRSRGRVGAWISSTIGLGSAAGIVVSLVLTSSLSDAGVNSWGWRIPFLIALPLGLIGLYLRLRLEESPEFAGIEQRGAIQRAPLVVAVRSWWRSMVTGATAVIVITLAYYLLFTYMPTYLTSSVGLPKSQSLVATLVGLVVYSCSMPFIGSLSDRVGRRPILMCGAVGAVVLPYPVFLLFQQGSLAGVIVGCAVLALTIALMAALLPSFLSELFPTTVRFSAFSITYNIPNAVFGGTAPFVAAALVTSTGNDFMPASYIVAAGVVSLIGTIMLKETAHSPLKIAHSESQPDDGRSMTPAG